MTLGRLGPYLVPLIVIGYSGYMITEQMLGNYRESSQNYALFMGGIAIACALFVMARHFLGQDAGVPGEQLDVPRWHYAQIGIVLLTVIATVLLIETVGYFICLSAMLAINLYVLGVRSKVQIATITGITILVVHVLLVKELELPLPAGILSGIL